MQTTTCASHDRAVAPWQPGAQDIPVTLLPTRNEGSGSGTTGLSSGDKWLKDDHGRFPTPVIANHGQPDPQVWTQTGRATEQAGTQLQNQQDPANRIWNTPIEDLSLKKHAVSRFSAFPEGLSTLWTLLNPPEVVCLWWPKEGRLKFGTCAPQSYGSNNILDGTHDWHNVWLSYP